MRSALLASAVLAMTVGQALAGVEFAGVNIAGFDFGCETTGECNVTKVVPPLKQYKGRNGAAQMQHFVKNGKLNAFRLPVAWQYLVEEPGAPLIKANMEKYDALMKACLATGSLCIIDIHNFARWDDLIIGQGGPTDEEFADLWSQLATQYKSQPKVVMGIVNEPHEVPDITRWAQTCQTVVDAIRKAGATEHYITLPGNGYTSAGTFVPSGSAKALARVKDADGSTDKLIFEVHKYLDEDNSGTHLDCVSNNIDAFEDLTKFLKDNKRRAILAETGGGPSTKSCLKNVCELLSYLNDNDDVYMGYLGWGAGSFDETYELSLTPEGGEGKGPMKDVPLMTECFIKQFAGGAGTGGSYSGGNSTTNQTSSSDSISSGSYGGSSDQASSESTSGEASDGSSEQSVGSGTPSEQSSDDASDSTSTDSTSNTSADGSSDQLSEPGTTSNEPSGGYSDPTSADSTSENSASSDNDGSSSSPSSSGSPDQSSGNSYGGGQGGSTQSTQPQSPSIGSQQSTPGVVQKPGSPAGGATNMEPMKSGDQQVGGTDNLDIASEVNELENEDEAGDDECAADDENEEVDDGAAGDDNDSQNNIQSETNTQEENNSAANDEDEEVDDGAAGDENDSQNNIQNETNTQEQYNSESDNNTQYENDTDNGNNSEDSSPDPQPQPTTNPRPSSTFATSYIPTPTGFNNTNSASNSTDTGSATEMDMGGANMDGESSSSSESYDDGSDVEEGNEGEDMTMDDGSYA
ncbi:MAG: hypothetical protein LQ337_003460 [Flavoplaca oasis]|nr:MAG: hypothetical protein LQ337_003460 [Flavoplaca oasis]